MVWVDVGRRTSLKVNKRTLGKQNRLDRKSIRYGFVYRSISIVRLTHLKVTFSVDQKSDCLYSDHNDGLGR